MNFDPKKPYGTVIGHHSARFEQGGRMFDGSGKSLYDPEEDEEVRFTPAIIIPVADVQERDFALDNARDFLTNILKDGALPRSTIFKECAANNQDWDKVKTAFADLEGDVLTRRNVIHWKLKAA